MSGRVTKKMLKEAITDSGGIVLEIARRLGVTWRTANKYIHKWPDTLQMFTDESEKVLDLAEKTIVNSIKAGDTQDAKWLLARKGKTRGYGDNVDVTSDGERIVTFNVVYPEQKNDADGN